MSKIPHRTVSRLASHAQAFSKSEDGGATIWCLTWLIGLGIMAGLSIDATNAWRHQTILQSTADAAALAGAWELPENYLERPYVAGGYTAVEDAALNFAGFNITADDYGPYFNRSDIVVGNWNKATRSFTPGALFPAPDAMPVNAVQVQMEETTFRGNGVPTALLHIIGFGAWDVRTTATAVYGILKCYQNGLIAREGVDVASNAQILKNICLHGQLFANVNNNVYWKNSRSLTTGRSPEGTWEISPGQYDADGNPVDLTEPQRQNLYPLMVDMIPTIGRGMLKGEEHFRHFLYPQLDPTTTTPPTVIALPEKFEHITGSVVDPASAPVASYDVDVASLETLHRTATYGEVELQGGKYKWPLDDPAVIDPATDGFQTTTEGAPTGVVGKITEDRVYFADRCRPAEQGGYDYITLSGVVRNFTLVTNCQITIQKQAADGTPTRIENAVLLSTAGYKGGKSVFIENGVQIGANSACADWGGVRIYANGNLSVPSSGSGFSQWYAAHMVVRGDVHLAGQNDSAKGFSIMAGGDIKIEGNATIGALEGALDDTYPAGGCTPDGVKQEVTWDAFVPILVD